MCIFETSICFSLSNFVYELAGALISFTVLGQQTETERTLEHGSFKPNIDARLNDLKLTLGPELRIVYPLILNFAVSGDLELNGMVHPKYIRPKGILTFENGEVNLVATQVSLIWLYPPPCLADFLFPV
jgi:hypothetical protein